MIPPQTSIVGKLLIHYFTYPRAHHHLRFLARRLEVDHSNLSKKLKELEKEGLFKSYLEGSQRYYALNPRFPLLQEYRMIVEKAYGVKTKPFKAERYGINYK